MNIFCRKGAKAQKGKRHSMYHVGIAGPIGSGKSFLARYIKARSDVDVAIVPFALHLKTLCAIQLVKDPAEQAKQLREYLHFLGCDNEAVFASVLYAFYEYPAQEGEKNRKLLQVVGTDIMRAWNPNIWVTSAFNYARKIYAPYEVIIHDDVRFLNEAQSVNMLVELTGATYTVDHASELAEWKKTLQADFTVKKDFRDASWLVDAIGDAARAHNKKEHERIMRMQD